MREPLAMWVVVLTVVGGVVVPSIVWGLAKWRRGRVLLRRVRAARPGCVAYLVDPVPQQPELERLTGGPVPVQRMVLSAEATGVELWSRDSPDPIAQLPWSSVDSTGMGSYRTAWGGRSSVAQTIALNLTGGHSIHFAVPGPRLPLDVLEDLESTREPAAPAGGDNPLSTV